jgi:hypothetical protein
MGSLIRSAAAVLVAAGALAVGGVARADNVVARWIQLGPGSSAGALANGSYGDQPASTTPTILARAIISGGACPSLMVDGSLSITMNQRFVASQLTSLTNSSSAFTNGKPGYPAYFVSANATSPANFPDGTAQATTGWGECEAVVPAGHTTATINGVDLKLPVANPQRILVIADTGCRMSGSNQQDCHSPSGFPFAALANYEALFKPDLILQVGDYFYRDTTCLVSGKEFVAGCNTAGNANFETWADTFDSWNADLFYPGNTLLATAPWVMTRGNHESCGRGARGWFALLDPHPYDFNLVNCQGGAGNAPVTTAAVYTADFSPTYIVPAGNVNLLVHDSSFANDAVVDPNMAANYDFDLTALLNTLPVSSNNIFMTHKPTYGLVSGAPTSGGDFTEQFTFSGNATANSAFSGGVPYKIGMFLSGHIHQFEYLNFNDYTHFAPQLVVGVGGDNLDPTANPNGTSPTYAYQAQPFTVHNSGSTTSTTSTTVHAAYAQAEFGFALLQATPTGYIASVYNINANKAGRCTITLSTPGPRGIVCWD